MPSKYVLVGFDVSGLSINPKYVKRFDRKLRYVNKEFLGYNVMTVGEFKKLNDSLNIPDLVIEKKLHRVEKEFGMMDPEPSLYIEGESSGNKS